MYRCIFLASALLAPALAQDPGAPSTESLPEPPSVEPAATSQAPAPPPPPAPPAPPADEGDESPLSASPDLERPTRMAWVALGATRANGEIPRDQRWMPALSVGGGLELSDYLTVFGELGHARAVGKPFIGSQAIDVRASSWELLAGLRGQIRVDEIAVPYATLAVGPALSQVFLDGSPVGLRDATDSRGAGVGLAGRATAGLELMLPVEGSIRPTLLGEVGLGGVTGHPVRLSDDDGNGTTIGRYSLGPLTARIALGLRF